MRVEETELLGAVLWMRLELMMSAKQPEGGGKHDLLIALIMSSTESSDDVSFYEPSAL